MASPGGQVGGSGQVTDDADGSGIQVDIHEGSTQTKSMTSVYGDTAIRRGIIDGTVEFDWLGEIGQDALTNHDQLQRVILVILGQPGLLIHGFGPTGEIGHPYATPFIPLDRIKVWRWGKHAYFELHYRHTRTSLLPFPAAHTATWEGTFVHGITFRHVTLNIQGFSQAAFLKGLPNGDLDISGDITDPSNRPRATVYKRAAQRLTIRSIVETHPHVSQSFVMLGDANNINALAFGKFGEFELPIPLGVFTTRYDGTQIVWIAESRWLVRHQFTVLLFGHWQQRAVFGTADPGAPNTPAHWYTILEQMNPSALWDKFSFPVAF